VIFSSNIIKISESSRDRAYKKERRKMKGSKTLQIKGEVNISRGEKHFNFKKSFLMSFYFFTLHHTISKTLSKIIENAFLTLFEPSFSLAIYMN
jgi:hypothetical protein